jgi:hypothetical protein
MTVPMHRCQPSILVSEHAGKANPTPTLPKSDATTIQNVRHQYFIQVWYQGLISLWSLLILFLIATTHHWQSLSIYKGDIQSIP